MAWIPMFDERTAEGELAETYRAFKQRPLPPAYHPPHGGIPGIVRAHSLDPRLLVAVFGVSGSLRGSQALSWAEWECVAAATARAGQCFY
jgi:hypothetical protein